MAYADSILHALTTSTAVVPSLWSLEVGNALLFAEIWKRVKGTTITRFFTLLEALPITVDSETGPRAWKDTWLVAQSYGLSTYDASYLEFALRRRLPLASLDKHLREAAQRAGVLLYES